MQFISKYLTAPEQTLNRKYTYTCIFAFHTTVVPSTCPIWITVIAQQTFLRATAHASYPLPW